jgi:type VI secretion system secreted protein VgrG
MSHLSLSFGAPAGGAKSAAVGGDEKLDIRHYTVIERLSEPFVIHILAVSPSADLDPGEYVGRDASFSIDTGPQGVRSWSGLVSSFELAEVEEGGLSTYELTVTARLAILDHRSNCRIFQRQSAVDIAQKILGEWGIKPELRISEDHQKLEYRVQYHESDLGFINRILSEAGISFFFEGDSGESSLVLCDQPQTAAESRPPLPYRSSEHDDTDGPHARNLVARKEIGPAAVTIGDFDFRRPAYGLFHTADRGEASSRAPLEQFIYRPGSALAVASGGGASDTPAADALSMARVDEHLGRRAARSALEGQRGLEVELQSNVSWLAPGTAFSVSDHPKLSGKRLIVTEARITGQFTGSFAAIAVARHASSAIRPAPVARPVMPGMQSAVVVGPSGDEIHTDEFGRVRVQFHWDREGSFNEQSTCWLRVSEGWGGAGFGLFSVPRVGHEVLVDFVAGNPDEPMVIGRVHGGTTPTAFGLPGKSSKTGWNTQSTPDGDGFHEVTFEDRKGQELFFIRSHKDFLGVVQNEEEESVGRDRVGQIGENMTTAVTENDALEASAFSAVMGKVQNVENIQQMGAASAAATLTLREMVPGKITLTTGGTMVQLIDDEIYVVADETLKINGKLVDVQGGPFVHLNPPGQFEAAETKKNEQEGHVVWFELRDKNRKPIPNLECYVEEDGGETSHVQKTDGQGRVLFNVDKEASYNLVVGRKPEPAAAAATSNGGGGGGGATALAAPAAKSAPKGGAEGNKGLKINAEGLKLVRKSEGFYSKPYLDPVKIPTIGYGTIQYPNGRAVTMKDPPITEAQAEEYLRHEVKEKEAAVRKMVKVPLNENQFSALTSFAYNGGTGALQDSTLLKKLNAGDYDGAAGEFGKWNKGTVKNPKTGKKERVVLKGLTTRRAAERKLFETPANGAQPKAAANQANGSTALSNGANGGGGSNTTQAAPAAPAPAPEPVKVGTVQAKPAARAQMSKHTVPMKVEVSSPQGSETLTIEPGAHPGADPSMPSIKLKGTATLSGQPIPEGMFRWQIFISGQYKTRMGMKEYNLLAGDAQTKPDQEVEFKLAPPSVVGGNLMVKVQFEHPTLGTVQVKTIKGIKVQGKNPSKSAVQALIKEIDPGMGWIIFPMLEQESGYRQFKSPDEVLVGPPAGIGLTQRDAVASEWGSASFDPSQPNRFFPRIYWDWKENVRAGMELLKEKQAGAKKRLESLQSKNNLPPYTKGMLARETLRRYNGGTEYGAANGKWKVEPQTIDPKTKKWVPLDPKHVPYVDKVLGRMNPADIPAEYADITKKSFP